MLFEEWGNPLPVREFQRHGVHAQNGLPLSPGDAIKVQFAADADETRAFGKSCWSGHGPLVQAPGRELRRVLRGGSGTGEPGSAKVYVLTLPDGFSGF